MRFPTSTLWLAHFLYVVPLNAAHSMLAQQLNVEIQLWDTKFCAKLFTQSFSTWKNILRVTYYRNLWILTLSLFFASYFFFFFSFAAQPKHKIMEYSGNSCNEDKVSIILLMLWLKRALSNINTSTATLSKEYKLKASDYTDTFITFDVRKLTCGSVFY